MEKQRPCYDRRIGNIRVAIWENSSDNNGTLKKWHNVSLTRRYMDGEKNWKDAPTLNGLGDLTQAMLALQLAIDWIKQRQESSPPAQEAVTE